MKMTHCNSCKEIFPRVRGSGGTKIHSIRVIVDNIITAKVDIDLCAPCLEKLDLIALTKNAVEEPEPLMEAIRELVREEIESSFDA